MLLPLLMNLDMFGAGAVVVTDTHDGFDHHKKRKKDEDDFRSKRERLHADLERAFNTEFGIVVEEELEEYIEPQLADSVLKPPIERIDWSLVAKHYEEVQRKIEALQIQRVAWEREQEYEDDLLLLS